MVMGQVRKWNAKSKKAVVTTIQPTKKAVVDNRQLTKKIKQVINKVDNNKNCIYKPFKNDIYISLLFITSHLELSLGINSKPKSCLILYEFTQSVCAK